MGEGRRRGKGAKERRMLKEREWMERQVSMREERERFRVKGGRSLGQRESEGGKDSDDDVAKKVDVQDSQIGKDSQNGGRNGDAKSLRSLRQISSSVLSTTQVLSRGLTSPRVFSKTEIVTSDGDIVVTKDNLSKELAKVTEKCAQASVRVDRKVRCLFGKYLTMY